MKCETYREDMLDVLYGEADGEAARRFRQHEQACQACRQEMRDLSGVRSELAGWSAPKDAPLQIPGAATALGRTAPAWLLLAATVLVSVGASVALTRIAGREPAATAQAAEERTRELAARLAAQEARYEKELASLRAGANPRPTADQKDGAVLAQVEALLRASEARQAAYLQASLAEARERTDAQRRYDLAQMKAGLSYLDGKTGLQAARTTELVGHVLQASQRK